MMTIINDALEFTKNIFKDDYSGHDYFHTLRVYKMATRIAEQENANIMVVQLAALLHDVDDIKLSPETHINKDRARAFLKKNDVSEEMIKMVCRIINEVSFKGMDSVVPETIEGKCVQDADRLDAIGAIGIARAFTYGGSHNRVIYDPEIKPVIHMNADEYYHHVSTTINHFYEKLFQLGELMDTITAKKIAEQREILNLLTLTERHKVKCLYQEQGGQTEMMTVKEISKLTGISVRTLHYYDEIGLFMPTEKSEAGYRLYDDKALENLQQILFFREFDIPLKEIKAVMDNPDLDRNQILQMQRKMLATKKESIERLISNIDDILDNC